MQENELLESILVVPYLDTTEAKAQLDKIILENGNSVNAFRELQDRIQAVPRRRLNKSEITNRNEIKKAIEDLHSKVAPAMDKIQELRQFINENELATRSSNQAVPILERIEARFQIVPIFEKDADILLKARREAAEQQVRASLPDVIDIEIPDLTARESEVRRGVVSWSALLRWNRQQELLDIIRSHEDGLLWEDRLLPEEYRADFNRARLQDNTEPPPARKFIDLMRPTIDGLLKAEKIRVDLESEIKRKHREQLMSEERAAVLIILQGSAIPVKSDIRLTIDNTPEVMDFMPLDVDLPDRLKPADQHRALYGVVSTDKDRPALNGIYVDQHRGRNIAVACDGKTLICAPLPEGHSQHLQPGSIYCTRNNKNGGQEGDVLDFKYPPWRVVVPTQLGTHSMRIELEHYRKVKQVCRANSLVGSNLYLVRLELPGIPDVFIDPKRFVMIVDSLSKLGYQQITLSANPSTDIPTPLVFTTEDPLVICVLAGWISGDWPTQHYQALGPFCINPAGARRHDLLDIP